MAMDDRTAETTLKTIAQSLGLTTAVVWGRADDGAKVMLINARDPAGQTYRVSAPTLGEAVVAFAQIVGFELED